MAEYGNEHIVTYSVCIKQATLTSSSLWRDKHFNRQGVCIYQIPSVSSKRVFFYFISSSWSDLNCMIWELLLMNNIFCTPTTYLATSMPYVVYIISLPYLFTSANTVPGWDNDDHHLHFVKVLGKNQPTVTAITGTIFIFCFTLPMPVGRPDGWLSQLNVPRLLTNI